MRCPCMTARRGLRPLLLGVCLALAGSGWLRADAAKEYEVKAAFLYNFTKFVEWPASRFADANSPIVVAVLGRNPFGEALEKIVQGRKVNGHAIVVTTVESTADLAQAHVVFVAAGEEPRIDPEQTAAGLLTVGETEAFAARGGMIVFRMHQDKVRFEINVDAAERHRLKISAQLQKLATAVRRKS